MKDFSKLEIIIGLLTLLEIISVMIYVVIGEDVPIVFNYYGLLVIFLLIFSFLFRKKRIGKWLLETKENNF